MQRINQLIVVVLIVAGLVLSACTQAPASVEKIQPAIVAPIEGSDLKRVTLTEKAAERLAIQTVPVREEQTARTRTVGGEVVASSEANAAGPNQVWVRVRLNESDLNQVDQSQPARVLPLDRDDDGEDADDEEDGLEAEADEGPEGVDADDLEDSTPSSSGSLYYVVANTDQSLVPGQRVWVQLSLLGSGTLQKIVPYAAVIYDVHGETWVYTNPEPLAFVRHPVDIGFIKGDMAFLTEGPPAGTEVVTVGGAELYGTETGVSK